jgi:hypothetical protein
MVVPVPKTVRWCAVRQKRCTYEMKHSDKTYSLPSIARLVVPHPRLPLRKGRCCQFDNSRQMRQ